MKPSIPKGTRDFSPTEVAKRNYIFSTIKSSFENFGFQPIETPSFENSSTLMGKYGEEGDRLIFKILDSGEYFEKNLPRTVGINLAKISSEVTQFFIFFLEEIKKGVIQTDDFNVIENFIIDNIDDVLKHGIGEMYKYRNILKEYILNQKQTISILIVNRKTFFSENNTIELFKQIELVQICGFASSYIIEKIFKNITSRKLTPNISERALRYDLTVPFARYVAQHQNEISFPFKRYQMQPVWRADRPQKGRFREFFQCDADVVGSKSLIQEIEFVQLYDDVFTKLKLEGVIIKMNNRKILAGIAEIIGASDKLIDFTVALDKLDKIGADGVTKEMLSKGISQGAIDKIEPLFNFSGSNQEKLNQLKGMLSTSDEGLAGVEDLEIVINAIGELGLQSASLEIDVTLARGLDYYTGAIFEVAAPKDIKMGSIGGGGRYDDLTGVFGLKDMSGVGISFGLDRIYMVLEELNLFDEVELPKPKVVFLNFDDEVKITQLKAIKELRANNIKCEIYPDLGKSNKQQKKQWKYVDTREIEYVVSKVENESFLLKNMSTSEQIACSLNEMINRLK